MTPQQVWALSERAVDNHRFELRPEDRDRDVLDYVQASDPGYFPAVVRHARAVYAEAFAAGEEVWVLAQRWGSRRSRLRLPAGARYTRRRLGRGAWLRAGVFRKQRDDCDVEGIFGEIARQDFGGAGPQRSWVLAGPARGVVLFMYDDRGLVASAPEGVLGPWSCGVPRIQRFRQAGWARSVLGGG